jgi:phosphohistidine swiveling domain-containing protein
MWPTASLHEAGLLDLDDPAALEPAVAGAKAARLARARQLGLPALPGVVIGVEAARAAVATALEQLPRGSGAARLAVMRATVDPDMLAALRRHASGLGFPVVVRSSSPLEDDPTWSGAFSSFLDIAAEDLAKAVRGCWASAFAVDPLERAEHAGVAPDDLAMAVLVQRQVIPDSGGLARTDADGGVAITAVKGSPAPLLAGWERGTGIRVDPADGVRPAVAGDLLSPAALLAVARLGRRVRSDMGCDVVEWAADGERVTLLQCRRTALAEPQESATVPDGLEHPVALRLARLAVRFPGELGERLVLPWACAGGWDDSRLPAGAEPAGGSPPTALPGAVERRASELTTRAWGLAPGEARAAAERALADVRGPRPQDALRRLADLAPVPADEAAAVLRLVAAARDLADRDAPARAAPSRDGWEPFVYGAVRAHGERLDGVPAAPGIGAGMVTVVTNPHSARLPAHRPVLVAARPLPGLAPMMWGAAGLVTGSGSPAAHLLEVAHSLRVPAVVGCRLDERSAGAGAPLLAAVDGAAGAVFVVPG